MASKRKIKYNPIKLAIIELFLTLEDNSAPTISVALNVPVQWVNYTINEWLANDRTLTIKSKING